MEKENPETSRKSSKHLVMAQVPIKDASWSAEKERELHSLKEDIKSIEVTLKRTMEAKHKTESENSALQARNTQLQRDFEEMANKADKILDEKESIQKKLEKTSRELVEIGRSALKKRNEQLQRDFEEMTNKADKLLDEKKSIQEELNKTSLQLEELKKKPQLPSNLSQTLVVNPTSGPKGPLRGSYTVHVTGRQQSVDSVLDQGHRSRQYLEEETLQLRQLIASQGEEIKYLRKKELENTAIIEDLRRRLSGFASKQLTEGNPNFTDLSDKYRPTRIAERFHTVYDEEWTNALEVLSSKKTGVKNEEEAIVLLMNIVKDIYNFCKDVIKEQTSNIVMNLLKPCTPKAIQGKENELNKDVVKKLERQILVLRRENCMEPVLNLIEKFKEHSKDYMAYQKCPEVVMYVEKCVELLWLMATSDPSMILLWPERGDKLSTNPFNYYSNKGDRVSFAVWPAVLLHEGGPVLKKGYAQPM